MTKKSPRLLHKVNISVSNSNCQMMLCCISIEMSDLPVRPVFLFHSACGQSVPLQGPWQSAWAPSETEGRNAIRRWLSFCMNGNGTTFRGGPTKLPKECGIASNSMNNPNWVLELVLSYGSHFKNCALTSKVVFCVVTIDTISLIPA